MRDDEPGSRAGQAAYDVLAGVEGVGPQDRQRAEDHPERVLGLGDVGQEYGEAERSGATDAVVQPDGVPARRATWPVAKPQKACWTSLVAAAEHPVDPAAPLGSGCEVDVAGHQGDGEAEHLRPEARVERADELGDLVAALGHDLSYRQLDRRGALHRGEGVREPAHRLVQSGGVTAGGVEQRGSELERLGSRNLDLAGFPVGGASRSSRSRTAPRWRRASPARRQDGPRYGSPC